MQGRGSKRLPRLLAAPGQRRPSCRGVDRNIFGLTVCRPKIVAPHAGAWIETRTDPGRPDAATVAPHAGAWIETRAQGRRTRSSPGRPSCRGVDRNHGRPPRPGMVAVAPHAGAWIETSKA